MGKTKCYINKDFHNEQYHIVRGDIAEWYERTDTGIKVYGFKYYGIPIGSDVYIKTVLNIEAERIKSTIFSTWETMDPNKILKPEIPSRQCLWCLLLSCLQHLGNYWARHLPSHLTDIFYKKVDDAIINLFSSTTCVDVDNVSENTKTTKPYTM